MLFYYGAIFITFFIAGFLLNILIMKLPILTQFLKLRSRPFTNLLSNIKPNSSFLAIVASFEAVIIGFLIPLTLDVTSKISERYSSEIISRLFNNFWALKILPLILIINIVLIIILQFFLSSVSNSILWIITECFILVSLIFIAFAVLKVINRTKYFVMNKSHILNLLYKEIETSYTKNIKKSQINYIQGFEGLGDIFTYESKSLKNASIIIGLKKIEQYVKKLFELQEINPERFNALIFSEEYYDLTNKKNNEVNLALAFNPEKYLIGYTIAIDQIIRIHKASLDSRNNEISKQCIYTLIWIIEDLASKKHKDLFLENMLQKMIELSLDAFDKGDISSIAASTQWYTSIAYNRYENKNPFEISNLGIFNKYLFYSLKNVISGNHERILSSLVQSLTDGIHLDNARNISVFQYSNSLFDIIGYPKYQELENKDAIHLLSQELDNSKKNIFSETDLLAWNKRFSELEIIVESTLSKEQQETIAKIKKSVLHLAEDIYLHNNLIEVILNISAYCLFKKKYHYISKLWDYKQPKDSDSVWIGHSIIPETIEELLLILLNSTILRSGISFFDGHHGSQKYLRQIIILLIGRIIKDSSIENINFSNLLKINDIDIFKINNLEYEIDKYIEDIPPIITNESLLKDLGFFYIDYNDLFGDKVSQLLSNIKKEILEKRELIHIKNNISIQKVNEFRDDLLSTFYEHSRVRDLYKSFFNRYFDNSNDISTNKGASFQLNQIIDKGAFFNDWHVHFGAWGKQFGTNIAINEDNHLLSIIKKNSVSIDNTKNIYEVLNMFDSIENIVIISCQSAYYSEFKNDKNFKPKWKIAENNSLKSFSGFLNFRRIDIPLFEINSNELRNHILILDKTHCGNFIQKSPGVAEYDENAYRDFFIIEITSLSENDDARTKIIDGNPDWLQKYNGIDEKEKHLKKHCLLSLIERFSIEIDEDFIGYNYIIPSKE